MKFMLYIDYNQIHLKNLVLISYTNLFTYIVYHIQKFNRKIFLLLFRSYTKKINKNISIIDTKL